MAYNTAGNLTGYYNFTTNTHFTADYRLDGRRAWRAINGQRTDYAYAPGSDQLLGEYSTSTTLLSCPLWGATGLLGTLEYASPFTPPVLTWFAYDAQGSVSQRLDAGGTVLSTAQYTPWGAPAASSGPAPTDSYGYNAQRGYPPYILILLFDPDYRLSFDLGEPTSITAEELKALILKSRRKEGCRNKWFDQLVHQAKTIPEIITAVDEGLFGDHGECITDEDEC